MSPRNTGHGTRRATRAVGVFDAARAVGGNFDRRRPALAARWLLLTAPPVAAWACAWWLR